jgi:hypothetical protein
MRIDISERKASPSPVSMRRFPQKLEWLLRERTMQFHLVEGDHPVVRFQNLCIYSGFFTAHTGTFKLLVRC